MRWIISAKTRKMIKRNLIASILILIVVSISMTGATYAWFTNQSSTLQNSFTAGTVLLTEPDISSKSETFEENDKKCKKIEWEFKNDGSKSTYVRVRPEAKASGIEKGGSSWVGVKYDSVDPKFRNIRDNPEQSQFFQFDLDTDVSNNPLRHKILEGSDQLLVGFAYLWVDDDKLKIKLDTSNTSDEDVDPRLMKEVKIQVNTTDDNPGEIFWPTGHYDWPKEEDDKKVNFEQTFEYAIPLDEIDENIGSENHIYIAVHINTYLVDRVENVPIKINLHLDSNSNWVERDGWWYYGTGGVNGEPNKVSAGDEVKVSFFYCVDDDYEGVTLDFVSLEAEAVQASNYAIDSVWKDQHPWYPLKENE